MRHTVLTASTLLMAATAMQATSLTQGTQSPIAATAVSMTYTKGSGAVTSGAVAFTLTSKTDKGSLYLSVSIPSAAPFIQVDKNNGTVAGTAPVTFTFSPSPSAASLSSGFQPTQSITINETYYPVSGPAVTGSTTVLVNLNVINTPAQISASLAYTPGFTVAVGATVSTATLTLSSSSDYLSYSVTPATTSPASAWIIPASTSGIVSSVPAQITVSFLQSVFDNSVAGAVLSGSITVKGPNNTVVIPISFTMGSAAVTASSFSPLLLPAKIPAGTSRVVTIAGTNFVSSTPVRIGSTTGANLVNNCAGFATATTNALCVQSPTEMFVRLLPADLASVSLTSGSGTLPIYVGPTSQAIGVTTNPIVSGVTDAAALVLASSNLTIAPYQILSFFGDNFTTGTLYGSATSSRYPNSLTDGVQALSVHFTSTNTCSGTAISSNSDATDGYLLFATPTQINILVPEAVNTVSTVYACVKYGSAHSSVQTFTVAPAAPGIFMFGGGSNQGVVVNGDGTINSKTNPDVLATNNTLTLYLSGLGKPTGGTTESDPNGSGYPTQLGTTLPAACADFTKLLTYQQIANSTWTSLDGTIVPSDPLLYPPCIDPATVTVAITGASGTGTTTTTYAGFSSGSVSGLYQINFKMTSLGTLAPLTTGGFNITVTITISGTPYTSQSGVVVYLK